MSISTLSIPVQNEFLVQIDQIANNESRTRSELVLNAVKIYINQKREFEGLFKTGKEIGSTLEISEDNIMDEIKNYRNSK
jgi:metal-responsive CopG/Arc/MetJ family transcriptional regulator